MTASSEEINAEKGTVVVGVDGSESSSLALRWALRQAQMTGARLRVVWCWEFPVTYYGWPAFPGGYDPDSDIRKALDEVVDSVVPADAGSRWNGSCARGIPPFR